MADSHRAALRAAIAQAIDADLAQRPEAIVILRIFDELCDLKDDIKRIAAAAEKIASAGALKEWK